MVLFVCFLVVCVGVFAVPDVVAVKTLLCIVADSVGRNGLAVWNDGSLWCGREIILSLRNKARVC